MSKVLVTKSYLEDIADSIRSKNGSQATYTPSQMAEAIINIPSGSSTDVLLFTSDQWDALTTAQKRTYGLVVIQYTNTGYKRGDLVNGADYAMSRAGDFTPKNSWNTSNNNVYTYNFDTTTPTGNDTMYCLAAMSQNGINPYYESDLPVIASGSGGNGNYAMVYGFMDSSYASTYSDGDNWNNAEIVCFCLSGEANPTIKELYYEQGQSGTYTYTYQASSSENLLLIAMRGGSSGGSYTITGLTQKSHVTYSGARFNDVYFGAVSSGDEVSITIPYEAGNSSNGSLFVALLSVEVDQ